MNNPALFLQISSPGVSKIQQIIYYTFARKFMSPEKNFNVHGLIVKQLTVHRSCTGEYSKVCLQPLFEAACRFWKIFDVAFTLNKILENASKI